MSSTTCTTAAEHVETKNELPELPKRDLRPLRSVNTDSTLPTHHIPPPPPPPRTRLVLPAHTPTIPLNTNNIVAAPKETNTCLSHVKEYAPVVGVVGTIIGVVVAIVTVVVK